MSFKAADDGDLFTLDEALAFIDSCESESQDDDARSSASVAHLTEPFSLEGIDELLEAAVHGPTKTPSPTHSVAVQAASPARKKKRVRSAASSSTVLQRRKRAELQSLRDQAAELEAYLAHLKGAGGQQTSLVAMKDAERLSPWQQHALLQYEQRQQSELTNRRLRETLEKQLKTANKLRGVLQKRNLLDGMEFVRTMETPCFGGPRITVGHSSLIMNQLEQEVEGVYRDFQRVYHPKQESLLLCTSQTTYDETCQANTLHFVTTTAMDWPMNAAFKNVWTYLESSSDRSRKPNALETKVNVAVPLRDSTAHFHKFHFLRKFEEKDRVVIIWSDVLQMTAKKLRFRTVAHAVFTRSEADPLNASVMHTDFKLSMDLPASGSDVSPEDLRYGQDVVLGGYGRLMRKFWQGEQNRLLEITSRPVAV